MKRLFSTLLSLVLVASLFLVGCSSTPSTSTLTGDYRQDILTVMDTLTTALELPEDSSEKAAAQAQARDEINDFIPRYRRDPDISDLASFMTMGTALNGLASHYSAYPNRPVPEKLKKRIAQEFKQAKIALKREAI